MHLKSLTLRGFKSFAQATTLAFEPGITCVVGPNGSGKSNVVDALSWVMGEQGAKSLRGARMDDVIFAGTSGRGALGRAEVSLTIDNSDGALPLEYTEVTIQRTMFRSGGSDYSINGRPVRLLDVQELLSDSGIGREMHVIVGQGQLDAVLQATPETRRGFIEEAAGVLKHRKRKEKALRKVESTQANLDRLTDLVAEIRRQLKPLGRQAEVARRAAVIQAEVRDARARLLADELTRAMLALEADLADEAALDRARRDAEQALALARDAEAQAERDLAAATPALARAQDTWYRLASLRERVSTTVSISAERLRNARDQQDAPRPGRDPDELDRDAELARADEVAARARVGELTGVLQQASTARDGAEAAHAEADRAHAARVRAASERREGLARLAGQLQSLRSRLDAGAGDAERLAQRAGEARQRAADADAELAEVEQRLVGVRGGLPDLDDAVRQAREALAALEHEVSAADVRVQRARDILVRLQARHEALELGLAHRDGSGDLLQRDGVLGRLAAFIEVDGSWQTAITAVLGPLAEALVARDRASALSALDALQAGEQGRATLLLADAPVLGDAREPVALPSGARWAVDAVHCRDVVQAAVHAALAGVVLVDDVEAAARAVARVPDAIAVTRDGQVLSAWRASGGGAAGESSLQVQAALDDTAAAIERARADLDAATAARADVVVQRDGAAVASEAHRERQRETTSTVSALTGRRDALARMSQAARDEAERSHQAQQRAVQQRTADEEALAELQRRVDDADADDLTEPDPGDRDRLAEAARQARQVEMDARLALRGAEEQARSLTGRADALRRAASAERQARQRAAARLAQVRREAVAAADVHAAAQWLVGVVEHSRDRAALARDDAEAARQAADARLQQARVVVRGRTAEAQRLADSAHRDEMARMQQRLHIDQLAERSLTELGIDGETLVGEYGPEHPVPVLTHPDGSALGDDDERPEPVPFEREAQQRRLRAAERNLQVLGTVNPLALEEFEAMQERHRFLAEQLDDLNRTRRQLLDIVDEVDRRVQEVFQQAWIDVEKAFEHVFARLFPGGEGRLVLTEPGQWLTTGIDVEARPAGKVVKRLSLLSGGERSLVAVAFLVSLFIARPSPFYILDEVEAALDDTNLGRLLDIYGELRENSQLLVITHQKRTMEIADALYGVTMRGDGVSTVISQRLRDVQDAD